MKLGGGRARRLARPMRFLPLAAPAALLLLAAASPGAAKPPPAGVVPICSMKLPKMYFETGSAVCCTLTVATR